MRWMACLLLLGCDAPLPDFAGTDLAGADLRQSAAPPDLAANPTASAIDPIAAGRSWTYDVQTVGSFPVCAAGSHTSSVLSQHMLGGRDAFSISSFCPAAGNSDFSVDGDHVYLYYQNAWVTALDVPVAEGHSWTEVNSSFTWRSAGSVTVPAGTFADCWKADQNVTYTAYSIYCRGVGMVRSYSQDLSGSGWDAQLSAKNF